MSCWIYFRKMNVFAFFIISQNWGDTESWYSSSHKTRICLSCIFNTMATAATIALIKLSRNITVTSKSAPWRLKSPAFRRFMLGRLFRHISKKTPKFGITGLCEGNAPVTGGFPHKGSVTLKMFPFDDAIMIYQFQHQKGWRVAHIIYLYNLPRRANCIKSYLKPFRSIAFNFCTEFYLDVPRCCQQDIFLVVHVLFSWILFQLQHQSSVFKSGISILLVS